MKRLRPKEVEHAPQTRTCRKSRCRRRAGGKDRRGGKGRHARPVAGGQDGGGGGGRNTRAGGSPAHLARNRRHQHILRPRRINSVADAQLSPETRLQLAPGVRTRFDGAGHVLLDAPNGTVVDLGPRGYAALSLFAQPLALGEAIARLEREAPATDFAPTMSVVNMLIDEGALVRPGRHGTRQRLGRPGGARPDAARRPQDTRLPGSACRGSATGGRRARHRHRERGARRCCRSSGCPAGLRGRGQRHRGSGRARVRGKRRGRRRHARSRLVAARRVARARGSPRGGTDWKRAARRGDPRDDPRRAASDS